MFYVIFYNFPYTQKKNIRLAIVFKVRLLKFAQFCRNVVACTGFLSRYRTGHFFNNSNTNEDTATKFKQHLLCCRHISYTMWQVRFRFRCTVLISGKIIKEMPGSVASGTFCIMRIPKRIWTGFVLLGLQIVAAD